MRDRRMGPGRAGLVALLAALATVGVGAVLAPAQQNAPKAKEKDKAKDWHMMTNDLQAAYQFLVDRTNRGELNLAKLCVVGLGEGANLAAAWAYQPGGAVSNEGRTSDLCALVLISPMADGEGLLLGQ